MQSNVIDLYTYNESTNTVSRRTHCRRRKRNGSMFVALADVIFKLTISVCMIFCCYLAYTML